LATDEQIASGRGSRKIATLMVTLPLALFVFVYMTTYDQQRVRVSQQRRSR
jgi:4-hydroxybenzoate polyprenyltransferase